MFRRILPLIVIALTLVQVHGQALLELPYGLKWGDSPEKLISWASGHSLDVNISQPGKQPALRVVRIEAGGAVLPGMKETALEARFLGGHLIEFTRHYADREASANEAEVRFEKLKQEVTNTHGALVPDRQEKSVEDQFVTLTKSFHHEVVKGLFLVTAFTEVEDLLRKSKDARYSLMYRNDNLKQEIEKLLADPAAPKDRR